MEYGSLASSTTVTMRIKHLTVVPTNHESDENHSAREAVERVFNNPDPRTLWLVRDYKLGEDRDKAVRRLAMAAMATEPELDYENVCNEIRNFLGDEYSNKKH